MTDTQPTTQEITERLRRRVRELLETEQIDMFIGYEQGAVPLNITPCFVREPDEADALVWNHLCINNLSTYLKRFRHEKIGVLVKGCDSRSIIELIKHHQITREKLYIIGIPCRGIVNIKKIAAPAACTAVRLEGDTVILDGEQPVSYHKDELLYHKCRYCDVPNPLIYDELLTAEVPPPVFDAHDAFADVEQLETLTTHDRLAYWKTQLNACIRCYACKNVCPMCFCNECLWDKKDPAWVTKYPNPADSFSFHMIRIYHMVGRCTGCMECERVCPVNIPLGTLFQNVQKETIELFGYRAGRESDTTPPLNTYDEQDHSYEDLLR